MRISRISHHRRAGHGVTRLAGAVAALAAAAALALVAPSTALADQAIFSDGPLTTVQITPTLNCAVNYRGDTRGEFFNDTACGTFVAFDGDDGRLLAGPHAVPAGTNATSQVTPLTPIAQSIDGSGTRQDPYAVTTAADANSTSSGAVLRITQVDSYVVGDNFYSTTTTISSLDDRSHDVVLSHGADCYLGDNDAGFGDYSAVTGAVTCKAGQDADSRIEQFIPQTAGSSYYYGRFSEMWRMIGAKQSLPDELDAPDLAQDNGIALSWELQVPAGGSASASMLTNFSPVNVRALPTTITPSSATVEAGTVITLTVGISNADNAIDVTTEHLTVQLPAGATYVPGSVTGASGEAVQSGNALTIPIASSIAGGASATVAFRVTLAEEGEAGFELSGSALLAPVLPSSTSVVVTPVPVAMPIAVDDAATTASGVAVTIPVLDNDAGDAIFVAEVGTSEDGTATANDDGTVTFLPAAGFSGTATFPYTIEDAVGQRASAMVRVVVEPAISREPIEPEDPATPASVTPGDGDLARTGSSLPVGLGVAAVVSLTSGLALLIVRRRRAGQV